MNLKFKEIFRSKVVMEGMVPKAGFSDTFDLTG